jgi:hypothetical protein
MNARRVYYQHVDVTAREAIPVRGVAHRLYGRVDGFIERHTSEHRLCALCRRCAALLAVRLSLSQFQCSGAEYFFGRRLQSRRRLVSCVTTPRLSMLPPRYRFCAGNIMTWLRLLTLSGASCGHTTIWMRCCDFSNSCSSGTTGDTFATSRVQYSVRKLSTRAHAEHVALYASTLGVHVEYCRRYAVSRLQV